MTTIKVCKDENGYLWAVALPDNAETCENGPVLGPPEGIKKSVHNRLVEEGIYNAFDLINNRPKLMEILRDLGEERSYAQEVTHLYQMQYYSKRMNEHGD